MVLVYEVAFGRLEIDTLRDVLYSFTLVMILPNHRTIKFENRLLVSTEPVLPQKWQMPSVTVAYW